MIGKQEFKMKKVFLLVLICMLSGCADHMTLEQAIEAEKVGFLHGLWHGVILLFSFIGSLFMDDVAIYAIYNNGGWYDFGYVLGIGLVGGATVQL